MFTWDVLENYRNLFESRISAEATEKLPNGEPHVKTITWSDDMEGHAKMCMEWYCELANKTTQPLYNVSTRRLDDHQFKEEESKTLQETWKIQSGPGGKFLHLWQSHTYSHKLDV